MSNEPLVSVMVPVYNGDKCLPLAVSSLINQTYTNWKCYIVNDGSTDGTKEFLDAIQDNRFIITHFEKNKGRPYARQAALDQMDGKYLAFLDADDFYHPQKLELQIEAMLKYDVSLVSCGNACFDGAKELKTVRGLGSVEPQVYKAGGSPVMAMRTSMILMSISKSVNFDPKLKYSQDTDFLMKYLSKGKSFLVQDKVLYYYSEFDSVNKKKVITTYFYVLRIIKNSEMNMGLKIKEYIKTLGKIAVYSLLYPFVSVEYFLEKRGMEATREMKSDFQVVLKQLKQ